MLAATSLTGTVTSQVVGHGRLTEHAVGDDEPVEGLRTVGGLDGPPAIAHHGVVQGYEMVCAGNDLPFVPLVVNTAAPPLPSMERCVRIGQSLGEAVHAAAHPRRVLLVASGGLSHWLPSNDPRDPAVPGERRAAMIHGRKDAHAFAAAREPRVRAMGGDPHARVNAAWPDRPGT